MGGSTCTRRARGHSLPHIRTCTRAKGRDLWPVHHASSSKTHAPVPVCAARTVAYLLRHMAMLRLRVEGLLRHIAMLAAALLRTLSHHPQPTPPTPPTPHPRLQGLVMFKLVAGKWDEPAHLESPAGGSRDSESAALLPPGGASSSSKGGMYQGVGQGGSGGSAWGAGYGRSAPVVDLQASPGRGAAVLDLQAGAGGAGDGGDGLDDVPIS